MPQRLRTKLLARQLWHLALADIISLTPSGYRHLNSFFSLQFHTNVSNGGCIVWRVANFGALTSSLVEVHIALASSLAIFRHRSLLAKSAHGLIIVWPIGFLLSVVDIVRMYASSSDSNAIGTSSCIDPSLRAVEVRNVSLLASLIICMLAYIIGIVKSRDSRSSGAMPGSIENHTVHAALWVLLGSIVSTAPIVVVQQFILPGNPGMTSVLQAACVLCDLGGLTNTCVYAILNRRAKRIVLRQEIKESEGRASMTTRAIHSFPVAFGETGVVIVPSDQAGAIPNDQADASVREVEEQKHLRWLFPCDGKVAKEHTAEEGLHFLDCFNETQDAQQREQKLVDCEADGDDGAGSSFRIGESVQARARHGDWQSGIVVSTSPLKIKLVGCGFTLETAQAFTEVRRQQRKLLQWVVW